MQRDEVSNDGGGKPLGRRGAKPCRKCGECHWQAWEPRPGSGVWYARVWFRGRAWTKKAGSHKRALDVAKAWEGQMLEGRFFPHAITPTDELLSAAIVAYCNRRGDGLGDDGHRVLRRWAESSEVKGKSVRDFSTDDAEKFLKRREAAGRYGQSTRNHDVSYLFTFFEDAEDRRRRDPKRSHEPPIANPMRGLRVSEADRRRTRYLDETEEKRLLEALPSDVDRAMFRLAIHVGLRETNLLSLDWDRDVRLVSRKIRGWSRKGRPQGRMRSKPERVRWVPLNDDALDILRSLPTFPGKLRDAEKLCDAKRKGGRDGWVFPNAAGTGPIDPKNWYHRVWRPALAKAGIENFRFHDLRHTTGTRLGMKGVRTRDIATALGHADERMAQVYEHAADAEGHMLAVMQKLAQPRPEPVPDALAETATENPTENGAENAVTATPKPRTASL